MEGAGEFAAGAEGLEEAKISSSSSSSESPKDIVEPSLWFGDTKNFCDCEIHAFDHWASHSRSALKRAVDDVRVITNLLSNIQQSLDSHYY